MKGYCRDIYPHTHIPHLEDESKQYFLQGPCGALLRSFGVDNLSDATFESRLTGPAAIGQPRLLDTRTYP
jgi:hypothetical protein